MKIMIEPVLGGGGHSRGDLMAGTVKDAILRGRKTIEEMSSREA
jgi:hypothetical protein